MKVHVQMAIYIFIALATLDVCSVNLISRASLKMPQTICSAAPARCSIPRTTGPLDYADGENRVLASTLFTVRTLQIP
jgi:hypothetical protein